MQLTFSSTPSGMNTVMLPSALAAIVAAWFPLPLVPKALLISPLRIGDVDGVGGEEEAGDGDVPPSPAVAAVRASPSIALRHRTSPELMPRRTSSRLPVLDVALCPVPMISAPSPRGRYLCVAIDVAYVLLYPRMSVALAYLSGFLF